MLSIREVRTLMAADEKEYTSVKEPLRSVRIQGFDAPVDAMCVDPEAPVVFRAPRIIQGNAADPSCLERVCEDFTTTVKSKSVVRLSHARIVGWNAVLDADDHLYTPNPASDHAAAENAARSAEAGHQGFALRFVDEHWNLVYYQPVEKAFFHRKALFIGSLEPGNYGSFIFRTLPRLLMIPELRLNVDCLILPDRSAWLMAVLDRLKLNLPVFTPKEVCGATLDEVYFFLDADNGGLFSPADNIRINRFIDTWHGEDERMDGPRALYISRRLSHFVKPMYHPLLNEQAVENYCASQEMSVVYPETLSFEQQLKLFRHAELIVGPSGSGMLNAAFAKDGATVLDLEFYSHCVRQHARIYSSTNKKYGFCFGTPDEADPAPLHAKRWTINIEDIDIALQRLRASSW